MLLPHRFRFDAPSAQIQRATRDRLAGSSRFTERSFVSRSGSLSCIVRSTDNFLYGTSLARVDPGGAVADGRFPIDEEAWP